MFIVNVVIGRVYLIVSKEENEEGHSFDLDQKMDSASMAIALYLQISYFLSHIDLMKKIFLLPLLILLLAACQGQEPQENDHGVIQQQDDQNMIIAPRIDSTLTFTSRISLIFQDSKRRYWIISHSEGMCRYDGKEFVYFPESKGMPSVRGIHEAVNGKMWFGIEGGVMIYDGETFQTIWVEPQSHLITEPLELETKDWEKEREYFWFSAFNRNGVYRFDGQKLVHLTLPVPIDYPDFSGTNGFLTGVGYDSYAVYGLY